MFVVPSCFYCLYFCCCNQLALDIINGDKHGYKVQPMPLYASEIWGLDGDYNQIENTQMFAFKRFLGVGQRTNNNNYGIWRHWA